MATKEQVKAELKTFGWSDSEISALSWNDMRKKLKELKDSVPAEVPAKVEISESCKKACEKICELVNDGFVVDVVGEGRKYTYQKANYNEKSAQAWISKHKANRIIAMKSGEQPKEINI